MIKKRFTGALPPMAQQLNLNQSVTALLRRKSLCGTIVPLVLRLSTKSLSNQSPFPPTLSLTRKTTIQEDEEVKVAMVDKVGTTLATASQWRIQEESHPL